MFGTGSNHDAVRRLAHGIHEPKRQFQVSRRIKNAGMGYDPQKTAEHQVGHRERLRSGEKLFQPDSIVAVLRRILPMSVNQDVHIKELQS